MHAKQQAFSNLTFIYEYNQNITSWQLAESSLLLRKDALETNHAHHQQTHTDYNMLAASLCSEFTAHLFAILCQLA